MIIARELDSNLNPFECELVSRGKALAGLYELCDKLKVFEVRQVKYIIYILIILVFCIINIKLTYLAELFGKVNEITTLLQGKSSTIFMRDKLTALNIALYFWIACEENDNTQCLLFVYNSLKENMWEIPNKINIIITEHLVNFL